MEKEQEGRRLRASSTSSLGREVRCACQFYQSDSLLPERQALSWRPSSRNTMVQTPPPLKKPVYCSEHEYEPIATPAQSSPMKKTMKAPVVRITDTDVMPVADSDDSIDDPGRFQAAITLDGDLILPLDGRLEDSIMEGKELRHDGDTPEEEETAEQFQDRLEENFFRTVDEAHNNQVDSKTQQEASTTPQRGGRSLQKLRAEAVKLRSRLKSIQRPKFNYPKSEKLNVRSKSKPSSPSTTIEKSEQKKASKMERLRMALPERPKFNLPERPKFIKIHFPDRSKFHIKRPNIHLPSTLTKTRKNNTSLREQKRQRSTESTYGSRRNIFDFTTMPRIFDRKTKNSMTTSSKESQSQSESQEGITFPRTRKSSSLSARWAQRFEDAKMSEEETIPSAIERSRPWKHPSLEEPRLAFTVRRSVSIEEKSERITWEDDDNKEVVGIQEMDCEEKDMDIEILKIEKKDIDPRLYGDQTVHEEDLKSKSEEVEPESFTHPMHMSFPPIDSRNFDLRESSLNHSEEELSLRSDREQQSSGSSSERRRHGVIEEIDSDEFFLRERGISQEDMNMGRYLVNEIRDALRGSIVNDTDICSIPPERPRRSKSIRSRKEDSIESSDRPPTRPKRERSIRRSQESFQIDGFSKHRVVYRADSGPDSREKSMEQEPEPLDDIVIVKPIRRKSKSSLKSQNDLSVIDTTPAPIVPSRRKRAWLKTMNEKRATAPAIDIEDWPKILNLQASSSEPAIQKKYEDEMLMMNEEEDRYIEPVPIAPKRQSRSRGTSLVRDDDRTSHGAESLPEVGYEEEDIPKDDESRDALPGYAVIEKRDKPKLKPSPPRRRRRKFGTIPRPVMPKRPQRAYSTLVPVKTTPFEIIVQDDNILHADHNFDDPEHLRNGEMLSKIQGRPLPAPPRPPRNRRGRSAEPMSEPPSATEVYASTQTDPLPDDIVIEEIMQAKLIMAPSRSGSQILISTERIPSPACRQTPPIPPLPVSQTLPEKQPTPEPVKEEITRNDDRQRENESNLLEMAIRSNEPLRISTLEVGDLRVDRLSVAQLEAYKIAASEIDAIVMSASEMTKKGMEDENEEKSLHPSLLRELLAIKSHLETVSGTIQSQERAPSRQKTEDACTATSDERIDRCVASEEEAATSKQMRDTTLTEKQSPRYEVLQVTDKRPEKPVRQSASPVRSLPPVISVTPDTALRGITSTASLEPQRAVLSNTYAETDKSSVLLAHQKGAATEDCSINQFVVFPMSEIPREFSSLRSFRTNEASRRLEPGLTDSLRQLMDALRIIGARAMRHFVRYVEARVSRETSEEKIREVELAICALLLVVAGLILIYVCTPHTVTHHHHWDFFNPPKG